MSENSTTQSYEVSVKYDQKVIDQGAHLFWRKKMMSVFILCVLYISAATLFTATGLLELWFGAMAIGIGAIVIGILYWAYRSVRARSISVFEEMNSNEAVWTFTENSFSTRSDVGTSEIVWKMLASVIISDEVWLLLYKNGSYSVLPVNDIEQLVLDFIECQVKSVGGEIIS